MKNNILKVSYILNIIIVVLTILAFIMMFTNFKFTNLPETVIASSPVGRFRFFTIDSNLLMGITSLILLIQQHKLLNNKIKKIDKKYYILLLASTTSVALTFTIVLFYLGQITPNGLISMYTNKNLFFHGIIPLLSIINFIFFENTNQLKLKHTIYSLIPVILYGIYYMTNVLIHTENNTVSPEYDWYYFIQNGVSKLIIVVPLIFLITYLLGFTLYKINKTS